MKISLIQMNVAIGRTEENFSRAAGLLEQAAATGADVILLPELWNTGFFPTENLSGLADPDGGRAKALCAAFAACHGVNLAAGSVTTLRDRKVFNTAYVFDRSGATVCAYDKIHLFSPMRENDFFISGDHLGLFQLDGINCGIEICYDLRFPEQARAMAVRGMDVMFLSAQWPVQRLDHLHTLAKARAIENQCFVCVCNACGTAPGTQFGGASCVFSPLGETLTMADGTEQILTVGLDLSALDGIRNAIPVFQDRTGFISDT